MQGAVDVLAEEHGPPVAAGGVDQRAGGVARAVVGGQHTVADGDGLPPGADPAIDGQRPHAGAVPGGGGDPVVAGLQVDGVQGVGKDAAAVVVAKGRGTAAVIEVAVGQQQVGNSRAGRQAGGHVVHQPLVARPAAGVDQGRLRAEAHQVDGRIARRRQALAAHLPEIFDDFHGVTSTFENSLPPFAAHPNTPSPRPAEAYGGPGGPAVRSRTNRCSITSRPHWLPGRAATRRKPYFS